MKKIISTFLISEEFEDDLLYIKLKNESEGVDNWVAIESDTTFRGDYKGLCVDKILQQDRFASFVDRIHVISNTEPILDPSLPKVEKSFFTAEFLSRSLCFDYIKDAFSDNDYVILADVDESLDFSDASRRDQLFNIFNSHDEAIQIRNEKFWYQPDCLNFDPEKFIPAKPLGQLKENPNLFSHRNNHCKRIVTEIPLAFEYAYCFSEDNIYRKCTTFAHDRYTRECITRGLAGCHWHKCPERQEVLGHQWDWFEIIELTEKNSPKYVRENLDKLNPNTINPEYAKFRVMNYNIYPHPIEQAGLLRGLRISRDRHYYRRQK